MKRKNESRREHHHLDGSLSVIGTPKLERPSKLNVNPNKIPPLLSDDEFRAVKNRNRFIIELVEPYLELIDDLEKETNFIFSLNP